VKHSVKRNLMKDKDEQIEATIHRMSLKQGTELKIVHVIELGDSWVTLAVVAAGCWAIAKMFIGWVA